MKDRRVCALVARWGAASIYLMWALSVWELAATQLFSAGFDWEQQGPALSGSAPIDAGATSLAPRPQVPQTGAAPTEAMPSVEQPLPLRQWPAGYRPIDAVIERLPLPQVQPSGNPHDKVTTSPDPQSWPGEISAGPLPNWQDQPLDLVAQAPRPSPVMSAVLRKAEEHTRRGMELGSRRAYFSARDEFIQSLTMIAQALDAEQQTTRHGDALAAGLRALEESDDFVQATASYAGDVNVTDIAQVHRTPVVRYSLEPMTPLVAMQQYYTFAQAELAASVEQHRAGSAALAGMGKLYSVLASDATTRMASAEPKAMTLHQAALIVDGNNAVAANELGVMLARYGRFEDALAWLQHSVALAPQPATWHNLAVVHQNLGQAHMAESARRQQLAMSQTSGTKLNSRLPEVRWVSASEFAGARSGVVDGLQPPQSAANPAISRSAQAPAPAIYDPQNVGSLPRMQPPRSETMRQ